MSEFGYVPYPEDDEDPLFRVNDLPNFARECVRMGYVAFSEFFSNEERPAVTEQEACELSLEEIDDILPNDIAVAECKRLLARNDEDPDDYAVNHSLITIIIRHMAQEIHTHHANELVDEGILEMVYLPDQDDIGYRLVEKEDNESTEN